MTISVSMLWSSTETVSPQRFTTHAHPHLKHQRRLRQSLTATRWLPPRTHGAECASHRNCQQASRQRDGQTLRPTSSVQASSGANSATACQLPAREQY